VLEEDGITLSTSYIVGKKATFQQDDDNDVHFVLELFSLSSLKRQSTSFRFDDFQQTEFQKL
jgi:hypothetical protein